MIRKDRSNHLGGIVTSTVSQSLPTVLQNDVLLGILVSVDTEIFE